jgi:HEAT repeats
MRRTILAGLLAAGIGCGRPDGAQSSKPAKTEATMADAETYLAQLKDPDEAVRARAARELHRMGHPRAMEACLATLDDAPDTLHSDYTPAVTCLIELGDRALAPLLDMLMADQEDTRLHAQRAVEGITLRRFASDRERWHAWWSSIGYEHDSPVAVRTAAVARLRDWSTQPSH